MFALITSRRLNAVQVSTNSRSLSIFAAKKHNVENVDSEAIFPSPMFLAFRCFFVRVLYLL